MTPLWPSFWTDIPEVDRPALREILTELLATVVLSGENGRERELFLTARQYTRQLADYLAPLSLELVPDPDRPIFQARPFRRTRAHRTFYQGRNARGAHAVAPLRRCTNGGTGRNRRDQRQRSDARLKSISSTLNRQRKRIWNVFSPSFVPSASSGSKRTRNDLANHGSKSCLRFRARFRSKEPRNGLKPRLCSQQAVPSEGDTAADAENEAQS